MAVVQLVGRIAFPRRLSQKLFREGHRVHTCEDLKAFATLGPDARPEVGCVLVDIDLPEDLDALPGFLNRTAALGLPVVILATRPSPADIIAAMKVGVSDFLIAPVADLMLLEAVETALGRALRQRSMASRIEFLKGRYGSLSHQQRVVALFVSQGHSNKDIAGKLGVAERTVKNYRKLALKKLAVASVPDLVRAFVLLDLVEPYGDAPIEIEAISQGADGQCAGAPI